MTANMDFSALGIYPVCHGETEKASARCEADHELVSHDVETVDSERGRQRVRKREAREAN